MGRLLALFALLCGCWDSVHTVGTIFVNKTSVFQVGDETYELSVSSQAQGESGTCSDGSTVTKTLCRDRLLEERPRKHPQMQKDWHTYIKRCSSKRTAERVLPVPAPYRATVCHPFLRASPDMELYSKAAVEQWVDHYTQRGFQDVYFYVHAESDAYPTIPHTTWFVMPWIVDMGLHYGGQLTAIHHCLYWNKMHGATWTLFGDVDEFVVVTESYTQRSNLIKSALQLSGHESNPESRNTLAGFDFGEYSLGRADNFLNVGGKDFVENLQFDPAVTYLGKHAGYKGHRKTLLHPSKVACSNVHETDGNIIHMDLSVMSILHARFGCKLSETADNRTTSVGATADYSTCKWPPPRVIRWIQKSKQHHRAAGRKHQKKVKKA